MAHFRFLLSVFVFLLLTASFSHAQSRKNEFLWEISGHSLVKSSYLYGTMHVRDKEAFDFSDSVLAKLYACNIFASEVEFGEMADQLFTSGAIPDQPLLSEVLSTEDFKKLNQRFQAELNMSLEGIRANQLDLLENLLGEASPDSLDYNTFLDAYLYELAQGWQKKTVGLEPMSNQTDLLALDAEDEPDPESLTQYLLWRLDNQGTESYTDRLKNIYHEGDLEAIEAWSSFIFSDDSTQFGRQKVLIDRNHQMADSLAQLMHQGTVFAAVGVAHLPGAEGIIELLRKKGYQVTLVAATYTGQKDYYESLPRVEPEWVTFEDPFIGYRIQTPTKAFIPPVESGFAELFKLQMSYDLGKGSYYGFISIPSFREVSAADRDSVYAALTDTYLNKTPQFANSKLVDSTTFTYDNAKGKEISLVDANRQTAFRIRMLLTEPALFILLAGGINAQKDEIAQDQDRFFQSFAFIPRSKASFKNISDSVLAFESINLRQVSEQRMDLPLGDDQILRQSIFMGQDPSEKTLFLTSIGLYPIDYYSMDDSASLEAGMNGFLARVNNPAVFLDTIYLFQGALMREFRYKLPRSQGGFGWTKLLIRSNRYYQQMAIFPDSVPPREAVAYQDAFKLRPFSATPFTRWKSYTSQNEGFEVSFPHSPIIDTLYDLTSDMRADRLWGEYETQQSLSFSALDSNSNITYALTVDHFTPYANWLSPATLDSIQIQYISSRLEKEIELYNTQTFEVNGFEGREYLGKISSTRNRIRLRSIVAGDYLFTQLIITLPEYLQAPEANAFCESLSITPKSNFDLYAAKDSLIIQNLISQDTSAQILARRAFNQEGVDSSYTTTLISLFNSQLSNDSTTHSQSILLEMLADYLAVPAGDTLIPMLAAHYQRAESFPDLQHTFINNLSKIGSEAAFQTMAQLLANPPSERNYTLRSALNTSADSGYAPLFIPIANRLMQDTIWQEDMVRYFIWLEDSGHVNLDTARLFQQITLTEAEKQLEALEEFLTRKTDTSRGYFPYYTAGLYLSTLEYAANENSAIKLAKRFEKLGTESAYLLYHAAGTLLHYGLSPKKATIDSLANNMYWLGDVFDLLEKYDRLDLFPPAYLSQEIFAQHYATNYIDEGVPDICEVADIKPLTYAETSGRVYCLKLSWEDYNGFYICFVGIFSDNPQEVKPLELMTDYFWITEEETANFDQEIYWTEFLDALGDTEE